MPRPSKSPKKRKKTNREYMRQCRNKAKEQHLAAKRNLCTTTKDCTILNTHHQEAVEVNTENTTDDSIEPEAPQSTIGDNCRTNGSIGTLYEDEVNPSIIKAAQKFKKKSKEQPVFICISCHRLMYRESVKSFNEDSYATVKDPVKRLVFKDIYRIKSADDKTYICYTCDRHIKNNKLPPQSKANGLELAKIPEPLQDLHVLEQRLIAKRIPFMRLISLPKGRQRAIHGPAVNVPTSLEPVCTLLPRLPKNAHLIPLKLKRKLQYKHAYMNNYIRPEKVLNALHFLKANNELYSDININTNWTSIWQTEEPDLWEALNNQHDDADDNQITAENSSLQYDNQNTLAMQANQDVATTQSHSRNSGQQQMSPDPLTTLQNTADINGFQINDVSIDSNSCMFAAVLHQLQPTREITPQDIQSLRTTIASYMDKYKNDYDSFVSMHSNNHSNDTAPKEHFDTIIDQMRQLNPILAKDLLWKRYLQNLETSAWGDELVLQGIADKFGITIHILTPTSYFFKSPRTPNPQPINIPPCIWLGFIPQQHYVSLTKKTTTHQEMYSGNINIQQPAIASHTIDSVDNSEATVSPNNAEEEPDIFDKEDQTELDKTIKLTGLPLDTCLQHEATDNAENIYSIAPGEDQKPVPILCDPYFEEMAHPNKYPYGQGGFTNATRPIPLSITKYANARLLDVDGRFSKDIDYFLALQYTVEHKQVQNNLNIAIRQTSGRSYQGQEINAGILKNPETVGNLIHQDKAYKFLKKIRGSPAYWQTMFYETLAMIRQLGIPTWFFTLSAADLQWPEVIQGIAAQYGTKYTEEEIQNLSWEVKSRWLRANPITAARNFQHRLDAFFTHFIKSPAQPIGPISDYVIRIEFQSRGSPHAHTLIWVKDAPKLMYNTDKEVTTFVDQYTSCVLPEESSDLYNHVTKLQRHSCSSRCRRYGKCRFNYPKPPTPKTIISNEPRNDTSEDDLKKAKHTTTLVKAVLQNESTPHNITIEHLLQKAGVTEEEYIQALSFNKQGQTIHLKRTPEERNINAYNKHVLMSWQANHDIQYVVNAYAAVMYVASYVLKTEKGMSELLKQAAKEAEKEEIRQQLKKVGSVFLTHREISAQEAVYRVLSMPLRQTSRKVININVSPKENRVSITLPQDKIQTLDDDDEEVFASSIIDKYSARPTSLEDKCLAWFAANYDRCSPNTQTTRSEQLPNDIHQLQESDVETTTPHIITLQNNRGKMKKRQKEAILRWHKFHPHKESEKHYRAKLFLYLPWRDEDTLKGNHTSFQDKYIAEQDALKAMEDHFTYNEGELNEAYQQITENGNPQNVWDIDDQIQEENSEEETDLRHMEDEELSAQLTLPGTTQTHQTQETSLRYAKERNKSLMTQTEYNTSMRSLNKEQRDIISYHRQWCKNVVFAHKHSKPIKPYNLFLSGPGGVGKSFIIKMLRNDTVKLLRNVNFITPNDIPILLTASTGVAAFNINGMTAHSAFALNDRKKTKGDYLPLGADTANTMQIQLEQLHVVILDEISMVGVNTLNKIHHRLQEIKKYKYANTRFGNVTIIAVGDLYQLPPLKDKKLFSNPGSALNPTMETLHGSIWKECFQFHELTQIVRQQDEEFIDILNNIRLGNPDKRLEKCVITTDDPRYKQNALHVFGTNKMCNNHNMNMMATLTTTKHVLLAEDSQQDTNTEQVTLTLSDQPRTKTGGLESTLIIAQGARVKLTSNIDVADGLSNGARGKVVDIIIINNNQVHCILVEFDNKNVGDTNKSTSQYKSSFPNAVPIYRFGTTFALGKGLNVTRTQFPLTLAWASTIHAVQGLTVDEIVVNMSDMFDYAQAYVAFSRVRTLEGLQILDQYLPNKIRADSGVKEEMERLGHCKITIPAISIPTLSTNWIRIAHLNVRGYITNITEVLNHKEICSTEVICFTETHLNQRQNLSPSKQPQENYQAFRHDRKTPNGDNKGGVVIFAHPHLKPRCLMTPPSQLEHVAIEITYEGHNVNIIAIYRPQTLTFHQFKTNMDQIAEALQITTTKTVIVGDFNEDVLAQQHHPINKYFGNCGFKQHITTPTTDYGSLLDHIYHNFEPNQEKYEVQDTYYSDHDVTFAAFQL